MKKLLNLIPAVLILFFVGCKNDSNSYGSSSSSEPIIELSEEELQQQLHDTECSHPAEYIDGTLSAEPRYKGIFSTKVNGLKLTFKLSSSATLATIKDVKVRVSFLSKTGSTVFKEDLVIYEYIKPGGSVTNKTEVDCTNQQWKDINDWQWEILGSECD